MSEVAGCSGENNSYIKIVDKTNTVSVVDVDFNYDFENVVKEYKDGKVTVIVTFKER